MMPGKKLGAGPMGGLPAKAGLATGPMGGMDAGGQTPPNLRPAEGGGPSCAGCKHFDSTAGACLQFGGYPVDATQTCDAFEAGAAGDVGMGPMGMAPASTDPYMMEP